MYYREIFLLRADVEFLIAAAYAWCPVPVEIMSAKVKLILWYGIQLKRRITFFNSMSSGDFEVIPPFCLSSTTATSCSCRIASYAQSLQSMNNT